jgi:AraC-like DNA-binding protein
MQHLELDTPEELRHLIAGFWYLEQDFGATPAAFEVLPDGHAELIFHFGSGCSILRDSRPEDLPSPFIVGLLGQPIHFYAKERLQIIGVKCYPWAVYDLLGLEPLKGGVAAFTHPVAALQDQLIPLLDAAAIDKALLLVRNWFRTRDAVIPPGNVLSKAGRAMLAGKGTLQVSSVAAAAHATVRTLERKFKASSGHTVKDVSGLMRFEQARDRLWCQPDLGMAGLAQELGYADQSHLNREFKRYCGMTAAGFARQAKARKAVLGDFVAIVLSS